MIILYRNWPRHRVCRVCRRRGTWLTIGRYGISGVFACRAGRHLWIAPSWRKARVGGAR